MKKKYAVCNFDGKELHPDDKKAIEEFIAYRKTRCRCYVNASYAKAFSKGGSAVKTFRSCPKHPTK